MKIDVCIDVSRRGKWLYVDKKMIELGLWPWSCMRRAKKLAKAAGLRKQEVPDGPFQYGTTINGVIPIATWSNE